MYTNIMSAQFDIPNQSILQLELRYGPYQGPIIFEILHKIHIRIMYEWHSKYITISAVKKKGLQVKKEKKNVPGLEMRHLEPLLPIYLFLIVVGCCGTPKDACHRFFRRWTRQGGLGSERCRDGVVAVIGCVEVAVHGRRRRSL